MKALTAHDVARELGRSVDWLFRNWERLVAEKRLPAPIIETGGLTWSAPQLYAVLDKGLTRDQRAAAAAYRAAFEAARQVALGIDDDDALRAARAKLDERLHARTGRLDARAKGARAGGAGFGPSGPEGESPRASKNPAG